MTNNTPTPERSDPDEDSDAPTGGKTPDDPALRAEAGEPMPTRPNPLTAGPERPRLRIGDAERQLILDTLQAHMAAGRIDMSEYEHRVEQATAALFDDDLDGLLTDLPRLGEEPPGSTFDDRPQGGDGPPWARGFDRGPKAGEGPAWADGPRGGQRPGGPGRRGDGPPWLSGRSGGRFRGVPLPVLALGALAIIGISHGHALPLLLIGFVGYKMFGRHDHRRGAGWGGGHGRWDGPERSQGHPHGWTA